MYNLYSITIFFSFLYIYIYKGGKTETGQNSSFKFVLNFFNEF